MRRGKLSITILLLLAMVWTMLPMTALAADVGGAAEPAPVVESAGAADETLPAGGESTVGTVGETDAVLADGEKQDGEPASETAAAPAAEEETPATEPAVQNTVSGEVPATDSLLPLKEVEKDLDLTGYLPHELMAFPVSRLMQLLGMKEQDPAVCARSAFTDENGEWVNTQDEFETVGGTIDLYGWGTSDRVRVELIAGTADQLDMNNTRYIARIKTTPGARLFNVGVYTLNGQKARVGDNPSFGLMRSNETNKPIGWRLYLSVDLDDTMWDYLKNDDRYYAYFTLNEAVGDDVIVKAFYQGEDVTEALFNKDNETTAGGLLLGTAEKSSIKVTFQRKGSGEVTTLEYRVKLDGAYMWLNGHGILYKDWDEGAGRSSLPTVREDYANKEYDVIFTLDKGYAADKTYYTNLWMRNSMEKSTDCGIAYVKKAVVGNYASEAEIPASAVDIKQQLFSDASKAGGGYGADFSKGVAFTVVDVKGNIHHASIKVEAYDGARRQTDWSTSFNVYGVKAEKRDYRIEEIPSSRFVDSYYENGYRTLFLMERTYNAKTGEHTYSPVRDSSICPEFGSSEEASVFASVGGVSAAKQISGQSKIPFTSGQVVHYSVASGSNLSNYWVTFLTQQSGAKLFVNAANNPEHYVEVDGKQMPQREVYLMGGDNDHHDIFIANVGDQDITGLYVKLENAKNVALDDYWTVNDVTTLSAFTTLDREDPDGNSVRNGTLPNCAKIRLVPQIDKLSGDTLRGEISGTLVIGYTGGGSTPVEEVRINLTGTSGIPKITTDSIADGTKYVPYSQLIQTNDMHSTGRMTFSVSGQLPAGLSIKPNGEIYGIPTTPGKYTFTVKAVYNGDESMSCTRDYEVTILNNTKENVLAVNDGPQGYALLDAVPDTVNVQDKYGDFSVDFRSEGVYDDFFAFYIDSQLLKEGTDYRSSEGSTRITIYAQTLGRFGNGEHTIAAEFRQGKDPDGEMKTTAQNVTVTGVKSGGGGSGGGTPGDVSPAVDGKTVLDNGDGTIITSVTEIVTADKLPAADKAALDSALQDKGSAGVYMNISAVVMERATGKILRYLTETPRPLQISVDIPQDMLNAMKDGKFIYVVRVHDGKAEFLDTTIRNGKATFSSDKFSTYALVLVNQRVEGVKTGDAGVTIYMVMAVAALAAGAGVVTMRKRRIG